MGKGEGKGQKAREGSEGKKRGGESGTKREMGKRRGRKGEGVRIGGRLPSGA